MTTKPQIDLTATVKCDAGARRDGEHCTANSVVRQGYMAGNAMQWSERCEAHRIKGEDDWLTQYERPQLLEQPVTVQCGLTMGVLPWESPMDIPLPQRKRCPHTAVNRQRLRMDGLDKRGTEPQDGWAGAWYTACAWHTQTGPHEFEDARLGWTERVKIGEATRDEHVQALLANYAERPQAMRAKDTRKSCGHCGGPLPERATGRPATYCGTRCRVAAHRAKAKQA